MYLDVDVDNCHFVRAQLEIEHQTIDTQQHYRSCRPLGRLGQQLNNCLSESSRCSKFAEDPLVRLVLNVSNNLRLIPQLFVSPFNSAGTTMTMIAN